MAVSGAAEAIRTESTEVADEDVTSRARATRGIPVRRYAENRVSVRSGRAVKPHARIAVSVRRTVSGAAETVRITGVVRMAGTVRTTEIVRRVSTGRSPMASKTARSVRKTEGIRETKTVTTDRDITENPDRRGRPDAMTIRLRDNERLDDLQRNGYRIIQNPEKFCFGMDAVLLTGFARAGREDILLDMGTGTGIIPILMEAKYHCAHFIGLEIQPESADMAARSVALNNLTEKIEIVTGDIREADRLFKSASFDCITCNPPYMIGQHGIANPEEPKAIARHEILCTFEDVARQAGRLLKPGGHLFLVHRPFRLPELICTLLKHRLEPKRMRLVYPYVDKEPNMVLLEAVRGGNPRMTVEKPLILFESPGIYRKEIQEEYGF